MKEVTQLPDGVYFIAGTSDSEINTKTYVKYEPGMTDAPIPAKYIGVKLGHRAIAVALEDLPGDENGELLLMPDNHKSPKTSEHYNCDIYTGEYRFNAFEDFDGKGNTERLKEYGCKISIPNGEWIPSMGELGLLMMHAKDVNQAIELAGGKPIKGWYWSSTTHEQKQAWYAGITCGTAGDCDFVYYSNAIRTVTEF